MLLQHFYTYTKEVDERRQVRRDAHDTEMERVYAAQKEKDTEERQRRKAQCIAKLVKKHEDEIAAAPQTSSPPQTSGAVSPQLSR